MTPLLTAFNDVRSSDSVEIILEKYLNIIHEKLRYPTVLGARDYENNFENIIRDNRFIPFIKALFNYYFSTDVYGPNSGDPIILSSGSVHEPTIATPSIIKDCIHHALSRDWYGYSDSCGRNSSRAALASLENTKIGEECYTLDNVSLTLGGTSAISSIVDLLKSAGDTSCEALCAAPNYPPLVAAMGQRFQTRLISLPIVGNEVDIEPLIAEAGLETRLILLQTVVNPFGLPITESKIESLLVKAPNAIVILDESHECHGPRQKLSLSRRDERVIRVMSASKLLGAPGLKLGYIVGSAALIRDFHAYASTVYGSPPSVNYLAQEIFGWFETWRLSGISEVGINEYRSIESDIVWSHATIHKMYIKYCNQISFRSKFIKKSNKKIIEFARNRNINFIEPVYSLNVFARIVAEEDSYLAFRRVLSKSRVSVYPAILCFDFDSSWCRLSPSIEQGTLTQALNRLSCYQ